MHNSILIVKFVIKIVSLVMECIMIKVMNEKYYSSQEVAVKLDLKISTIRRYIKDGVLSSIKIGRGYFMTEQMLSDFIETRINSTGKPDNDFFHMGTSYIPMLQRPAYEALRDDIKANGLKEPIERLNGLIVDGRARFIACLELGITPVYTECKEPETSLLNYLLNKNKDRINNAPSRNGFVVIPSYVTNLKAVERYKIKNDLARYRYVATYYSGDL